MSRKLKSPMAVLLILVFLIMSGLAQEPQRPVDDPDDEEALNRELWEFTRHTPYDSILPYVASQQRKSRATQVAKIAFSNGWGIAPRGTQVDVARLPYE